jgi:hypothetical protein
MSDLQGVTKISGHFISICPTLQQFMNVKKMKFIFIINSVNTYNLGKCAYNYIYILLIIIQLHTIIIQNDIGGGGNFHPSAKNAIYFTHHRDMEFKN